MIYYDYSEPSNDFVIILLLLLDFFLYVMCAFAVLESEIAFCIIVYLLATAVLILTVYFARVYFEYSKEAEEEELEK